VNITIFISNFVIEDCTLLIEVTNNLTDQPLIDIPHSFTIEQSEPDSAHLNSNPTVFMAITINSEEVSD
jgi:hypothetical protein